MINERHLRIDKLIKEERTGNPEKFAAKIGLSRSHLYRILKTLKNRGAPIKYSRKISSFYYEESFSIEDLLNSN